jgi:HlyD family type I secretion membrane fusion protein
MLSGNAALDQWHSAVPRRTRWPTLMGLAVLLVWGLGFGLWASTAPLDGAVVASGTFVATGQNKLVQHLEGGIVGAVLVRDGQMVDAGQPLIRLDDTPARTRLRRLVLRKYRLEIMQARLEAEMLSKDTFKVPASLEGAQPDPEIQSVFQRQQIELQVRRARQADEEQVLRKEIAGIEERIVGYQTQAATMQQRLASFSEELKDKRVLLERQLARKTDVLAIQRAEAGLSGELGDLFGRLADSKERIARAEQQIAQLRSTTAQKVAEELRSTETELDDVREQIRAARDVVDRVEIRAPVRGIVVRLNHHTPGAVVSPGATVLELLPVNDELIIEARVNPSDISHVHVGQSALVRLTALNQRITPMIEASVTYVSADTVPEQDSRNSDPAAIAARRHSYVARVALDQQDMRGKIDGFRPTPGMPADVYIRTGERTFFNYILRPLLDSLSRSFREH